MWEQVCVCVLFAAMRDLLFSLFEPWQQLLFYAATHTREQTRISICEKHTSYFSQCVCVCRKSVLLQVCGWEEKEFQFYEMIMEIRASVTERTAEIADVRCQHRRSCTVMLEFIWCGSYMMFCIKLGSVPTLILSHTQVFFLRLYTG